MATRERLTTDAVFIMDMPEVPAALKNCSTVECIAALLYLGWTHEEIAAATNVSKGTVQNRRIKVEGGNIQPPPEAFDLIRTREREVHRIGRGSKASPDALGTVIVDRMKAVADLEVLDIGPDGEISYEELVAFAALIAGQVDESNPQEVVKRLAPVVSLVDRPSRLSESVFDSSRLTQARPSEIYEDVTEVNSQTDDDLNQAKPSTENFSKKPSTRSEDNIDVQSWFSEKPDFPDRDQQFDRHQPDTQAAQISAEPSRNKELSQFSIDREECRSIGGTYDKEIEACWLGPPHSGNHRTDSSQGTSSNHPF